MQNILYQQIPAMNHTHAVVWGTVSKIVRRSEVRGYGTAIGFANTDRGQIRYPDLSVNFMAAENPDILK